MTILSRHSIPMTTAADVTECIGYTPLVRLDRYFHPRDGISICAKLEFLNPGGSVKDRIGKLMIEQAEREGALHLGGTIIEPTAGNTGIGLALVAAVRGYRCIFVVPERFSQEKQTLMCALGAEIVHTPTKKGMEGAITEAHALAEKIPNAVVMQQFANPANALAHYQTTGPEIWEQMSGNVDVAVFGAGTGGTFTGAVRYLREQNPELYAVIVQPYGASMGQGYAGSHKIEGIGIDDLDTVQLLDSNQINQMVVVSDLDAHTAVHKLARREGMLVGSSSGAAAHAAQVIAQKIIEGTLELPGQRIVTLFPDGGDRYLSKGLYGTFEEWTA
ncbi:MAG: cysteine synthase family protein [Anaerolineae bacterium]|nr:cysteine synthase family protein [Anaerolineae bacterium]